MGHSPKEKPSQQNPAQTSYATKPHICSHQ